jgi:hypothetical protein
MNHDDCGKWAFAGGRVQNTLHGFIAAFVGDGFAVGGERSRRECSYG